MKLIFYFFEKLKICFGGCKKEKIKFEIVDKCVCIIYVLKYNDVFEFWNVICSILNILNNFFFLNFN